MSDLSLLGENYSVESQEHGPVRVARPCSKSGSLKDVLHSAVWEEKAQEIRELVLERGAYVDAYNFLGQTPLFVAAYTQNYLSVKTLLQLGANPNARCVPGYTPTHAACYSGSRKILNRVLDAGGDLRLHDENHCTPIDWVLWQSDGEKRLRVLELIETARRCTMKQTGKEALQEKKFSRNIGGRASLTQLFKKKLPVKGGKNGKQEVDMVELVKNIHAMGFGKVYFGNGLKAAAISTVPYIEPLDLNPDRHHPTYTCGSFTEMSSKLWLHTRVTVRSLLEPPPTGAVVDMLISELEALCKLTHPQILLLMGVCQTKNYEGLMLVFEHVQLGSLYYCLHEKNCMPKLKSAVDIMLQVVDAIIYLHSHGWLHCSITSHAVHLVGPNVAKLASFELAIEDKEEVRKNRSFDLLSDKGWQSIYNWLSPEVLKGGPPSKNADLYSVCCLIWEICTGQVPWGNLDPDEILIEINTKGHTLPLMKKYIPRHLYGRLEQGLKLNDFERDVSLHEIRDMLILTRKDAVRNEKKALTNQAHLNASLPSRDSSTTDSGIWLNSLCRPVRSYSSSAIHLRSSSASPPNPRECCCRTNKAMEKDIVSNRCANYKKTYSILKRPKPGKEISESPQNSSYFNKTGNSNYDYVQNLAKRHFLQNGCVNKEDYIRAARDDSRHRSLSSLYHDTLCSSKEKNEYDGVDLSSSDASSSPMSPYLSEEESLAGTEGDLYNTNFRSFSSDPTTRVRSRSVPRAASSSDVVSNSAAEFVAAHLQEANKRGYGRTFSNLSQKSKETQEMESISCNDRLSMVSTSLNANLIRDNIKNAKRATQGSFVSPVKVSLPMGRNLSHEKNVKEDLVSSMSKLNLHLSVPATSPQKKLDSVSSNYNPSSEIKSPIGLLKEAYRSRSQCFSREKLAPEMSKFSLVDKCGSDETHVRSSSATIEKNIDSHKKSLKKPVREKMNCESYQKVDHGHSDKFQTYRSILSNKKTSTYSVYDNNKLSNISLNEKNNFSAKIESCAISKERSSDSSNKEKWSSINEEAHILALKQDCNAIKQQSLPVRWSSVKEDVKYEPNGGTTDKIGFVRGRSKPFSHNESNKNSKCFSRSCGKLDNLDEGNAKNPYGIVSNLGSKKSYEKNELNIGNGGKLLPRKWPSKGPNPNSVILSSIRSTEGKSRLKGAYSSISERKPSCDIIRSVDRISSPPRSQWSTKGVQNLIQNLESLQQKRIEHQQQIQNLTLYNTAPSNGVESAEPCGQESAFGTADNIDISCWNDSNNNDGQANKDLLSEHDNNVDPKMNDPSNNHENIQWENDVYQQAEDPWGNSDYRQTGSNRADNDFKLADNYDDPVQESNVDKDSYYQWGDDTVGQNENLQSELNNGDDNNNQFIGGDESQQSYQWRTVQESNCFYGENKEVSEINQWGTDDYGSASEPNVEANSEFNLKTDCGELENNIPGSTRPDEGKKLETETLNKFLPSHSRERNTPRSIDLPQFKDINTPTQSPIRREMAFTPMAQNDNLYQTCSVRTSTPNELNGKHRRYHKDMQASYSSAMAEAEEGQDDVYGLMNNSEGWKTADSEVITSQDSGIRSPTMVKSVDSAFRKKSSQKQHHKDIIEVKKEQNVTFNSQVLEISNSLHGVSTFTQTPEADWSSRRTSAASSFLSQQETEDLYCDDELHPSLENDPNMQLFISQNVEPEASNFPQHPMFTDRDSILSMDIPSTGPTSLRSEYSEDKDTFNSVLSSEDDGDNSVYVHMIKRNNERQIRNGTETHRVDMEIEIANTEGEDKNDSNNNEDGVE